MRWVNLLVLFIGCSETGSEPEPPFAVSGTVLDAEDRGVAGVSIDFESFGAATTGLDGSWSKSDLSGSVTITPTKDGWGFSPGSLDVAQAATDVFFLGTPLITLLELVVEWQDVGTSTTSALRASGLSTREGEPTHLGTRLEYPGDNAFFAQSLSRETAEEYGLITLEVPPAASTALFVAAVEVVDAGAGQPGQRDPIVWFGQVRDLEIVEGESTTVTMDDVHWVAPVWSFEDDAVRSAYESGTMTGDKDAADLEFFIVVTDPFGDRPWDEFIGLNGIGGAVGESQDGSWRVRVLCRNELVGQEHDSTCSFWPYLHSETFNLPDTRFSVPPVTTEFTVEWR